MSVLGIIVHYHQAILAGLWVTAKLCLIVWISGIVLGSLIGTLASHSKTWIGIPARLISFVLISIPALALLFWFHYPFQSYFHVIIDPFYTAAFVISLINIFAVSELVRGAMDDFPQQYIIAAKVCGLSNANIVRKIQLPIILRQILPGLLTIQVAVLHLTLFASLISVREIFRVAQELNATIYLPIQIYTALAIFFLIICLPLNGLAIFLKHKYTRNFSEK